jgi:hypothetical protein
MSLLASQPTKTIFAKKLLLSLVSTTVRHQSLLWLYMHYLKGDAVLMGYVPK